MNTSEDILNGLREQTIGSNETLNILLLIGEQERGELSPDIMIENSVVRCDSDVKDELLLRNYDTVFISKDYVKMHGVTLVKDIVKLYSTLTTTRVHYLQDIGSTTDDEVSSYLKSIGIGNITRINISRMTVGDLRELARENKTTTPIMKDQSFLKESDLQILKNELLNLPDNMIQDYVKRNKGEITEVITAYISSMEKIKGLNKENQQMKNHITYLEGDVKSLNVQIKAMTERRNILRKEVTDLRKSILSQKDKIDEYNDRVIGDHLTDSPIVELDEMAPIVIYFKEIEDIGFLNFYESILYTLSKVYKCYVKSVILEPSNRHFYDPYTELGYTTIASNIQLDTIIENDKLVRFGNPTNLLTNLANPELKVEIIMVFDRIHSDDVILQTPYILPMYLGYKSDRVKTLDIHPNSWISPVEGMWKNVKPLLLNDLKDKNDRLVYNSHVSKHPITNYIRELIHI